MKVKLKKAVRVLGIFAMATLLMSNYGTGGCGTTAPPFEPSSG